MSDSDTYPITVASTGNGPQTTVRVRGLLKLMLRVFGPRCIRIAEVPGEKVSQGTPPAEIEETVDVA